MDIPRKIFSFSRNSPKFLLQWKSGTFGRGGQRLGYRPGYQHTIPKRSLKRFSTLAVGFTAGNIASKFTFDYIFINHPRFSVSCENGSEVQQSTNTDFSEHFEGYEGEIAAKKEIHVRLFQYHNCPFCCKVRAFLDYYGIDYEKVEVNPLLKGEIKFSDYRKVPIVIVDDNQQLNDSSLIISILRSHMLGKGSLESLLVYYPKIEIGEGRSKKSEYQNRHNVMYLEAMESRGKADAVREEMKWRKWVDSSLVHMLSPNIYRTIGEAYQAFEYFSVVGNFSSTERFFAIHCGAVFMYFISKSLKKRYKLKDDVRESLYEDANSWVKAIGKKRKFMGGEKPNLADLSVYGVLSAIEGLDAFEDMMRNTDIKPWYNRMKKSVTNKEGRKEYQQLIEKMQ